MVIASTLNCNLNYRQSGPDQVNFLIMLVDDLGYGDLGCYGNPDIKTPNLDHFASQGLILTNGYASAPMCSPSRAGLLTGRTPYRTGVYDWIAPDSVMYLPDSEITIPELLVKYGYQTSLIGKWHLNGSLNVINQPQPQDHGFESWFACQFSLRHLNPEGFFKNGKAVQTEGYACDIVADEAIKWLSSERNPNRSFFQFINFLEPHEPIMSPPNLVDEYSNYGVKAEYYANVQNLDKAIGRVLDFLDSIELNQNTFVFFTSDNGPAQYTPNGYFNKSHGSAGALRGYKRHMFEGGIRVPAIARWPGFIEAGITSSQPVSNVDLLPTICRIANIPIPDDRIIDGGDITPIFDAKPIQRKVPLHWHFYDPWGGPQSLVRKGDFMLGAYWDVGDFHIQGRFSPRQEIPIIKGSELESFELYNLRKDIHQDFDVKYENPKLFEEMLNLLTSLHHSVVDEAPFIDP